MIEFKGYKPKDMLDAVAAFISAVFIIFCISMSIALPIADLGAYFYASFEAGFLVGLPNFLFFDVTCVFFWVFVACEHKLMDPDS